MKAGRLKQEEACTRGADGMFAGEQLRKGGILEGRLPPILGLATMVTGAPVPDT